MRKHTPKYIITYTDEAGERHQVQATAFAAVQVAEGANALRERYPSQMGKKRTLSEMAVGETKRVPYMGAGGYGGWHSTRSYLKNLYRDKEGNATCDWSFKVDNLAAEIIITRTL